MLRFIDNILHAWRMHRRRIRARRELSQLSDRELHDIGLTRSDIMRVSYNVKSSRRAI